MTTSTLPPLPAPYSEKAALGGFPASAYTRDQMIGYGEACAAHVRRREGDKINSSALPPGLAETIACGDSWLRGHGLPTYTELREQQAQQADEQDARRYRWLREQRWNTANLFVIAGGKTNVVLGADCPVMNRLDDMIDAALTSTKMETT